MPARHSYVRFFPSDWIAGTAHMSRLHRAVYFDVCCHIWDKAEPCPESALPLMFHDLDGWEQAVEQLIAMGKLERIDQGIVNVRAMDEANRAMKRWSDKSRAGQRGAEKRWSDGSANGSAIAAPSQTYSGDVQNQNQNQNQNNTPPNPPKGGNAYSEEFIKFWELYPNRKGKAKAFAVWKKLSTDDRQAAMSDVPRRLAVDRDWNREGGRYIPHASTYLNQRGWDDDIQEQTDEAHQRNQPRLSVADRAAQAIAARRASEGRG